jgi:hypothetical protein
VHCYSERVKKTLILGGKTNENTNQKTTIHSDTHRDFGDRFLHGANNRRHYFQL